MRKMKNCSPTSRAKMTQTHFKSFGPIFVNAGWYIDRTWTFLGTEISFFHVSYGHIAALSEDYIIHQSSDPSALFDTSSGIETDSQWFLTYQCFEHPSYCSFCHSATLSHPCQTHQWLPAVAPTLFPIIIVPTHTFCFSVMLCFPYLDNTDSHAVELHTRSDAIFTPLLSIYPDCCLYCHTHTSALLSHCTFLICTIHHADSHAATIIGITHYF